MTRSSATSRSARGITIHREDCPNVRALRKNAERFTPVDWEGGSSQSFRVQIAVDAWDRAAPARGRRPHVLRARREHRRLRRRRPGPAGEELVHGRDRRREVAARAAHGAAEHRGRVRRLPRHAELSIPRSGDLPGSPGALDLQWVTSCTLRRGEEGALRRRQRLRTQVGGRPVRETIAAGVSVDGQTVRPSMLPRARVPVDRTCRRGARRASCG